MELPVLSTIVTPSLTELNPYQLVSVGFLIVALGIASEEWLRNDNRECRRLSTAFGLILGLHLLRLIVHLDPSAPDLLPFIQSASLILLLWAFARPWFEDPELADTLGALLLAIALAGEIATWAVWLGQRQPPWTIYGEHWSLIIWQLYQTGLAGVGVWLSAARARQQRIWLIMIFALLAMGNAAGLFGFAGLWELIDAIVYPLVALITYLTITSDLRAFAKELRSISERSLRHMTEQIFLMEMSRAASETLEKSNILRVVADSSGLAFDADRVLLLLSEPAPPSEREAMLRVAARYYPLTDQRADSLQSHIYLRDALLLKRVVRGQRQLILSRAAGELPSRDLRALQELVDMEALEHAILEPLIFKGQSIGMLIAARQAGRPPFTDEETRLLSAMGSLVTAALENSRMYEELKATNERLTRLNEDLQRACQQLSELDQLKSSFIGLITHELRSPFVDLDLSLQLMRRYGTDRLEPAQREQFQQLEQGIARARRMVDSLVSFASLLSKGGSLVFGPLDFAEVVNRAVQPLKALADARGVSINVEPASGSLMAVGDRVRLIEAVHHLVHNAIKFNHAGGSVEVHYWSDGSTLSFVVEDTGIGISAEALPTVWQSFAQSADPFRRSVEGLGLGLALVRMVVEAHGGRVAAESKAGEGSSFGFQIPLRQPAQGASIRRPEEPISV